MTDLNQRENLMRQNTKNITLLALALVGLSTLGCATLGLTGDPKKEQKAPTEDTGEKTEEKKEEAVADVPAPEPNPELRETVLSCIDGFAPQDVQIGRVGKYKFTEGVNTQERTGFLDKKPLEMTNGCFFGVLQAEQCVAFTVDSKKYAELGNSNDWDVQCIYSDAPGEGAVKNKSMYSYSVDRLSPYYFMLMCGHDQGDGYECAEGSNSMRGIKWREKLEKEGKEQLGFCINRVAYQELSYKKQDFPKGRYLYCQYYNTKSKKSLFGYEFLLETNN